MTITNSFRIPLIALFVMVGFFTLAAPQPAYADCPYSNPEYCDDIFGGYYGGSDTVGGYYNGGDTLGGYYGGGDVIGGYYGGDSGCGYYGDCDGGYGSNDYGCGYYGDCGGGYYNTGNDYGCGYYGDCGGGYYDTGYYSSQPYSWNWNYDWGFEDSYQYDYEEYVYEWDYDWHFDDHDDRDDTSPNCEIDASDTSIEDGDDVTLRWESDRAESARLNEGIGSVSLDGSRRVSPDEDTTYVLTVRDRDGDTDTCSVTVRVDEDNNDSDLWCRLTASDRTVEEGDEITLEWDTRGAERASINQGIGRVDEDGGEEDVEVDEDTTFRLTVEDEDGDEETCSVTVRVDDENNFSSVVFEGEPTNNPPVVYLSSLPYTGVEDIDPAMLTFYAMLAAAALAGVWAAYRAGFIPSFAFASAEPIEEGHADGHAEEGPSEEASELLSKLAYGDTGGAVNVLRKAAVMGRGVEETLESALAYAPESAKAMLASALIESRKTGIRGAKDALSA